MTKKMFVVSVGMLIAIVPRCTLAQSWFPGLRKNTPQQQTDPFLEHGMEEQRRMAASFSGSAAQQAQAVLTAPNPAQIAPANIPGANGAYPWPAPVDSHDRPIISTTTTPQNYDSPPAFMPGTAPSGTATTSAATTGSAVSNGTAISDVVGSATYPATGGQQVTRPIARTPKSDGPDPAFANSGFFDPEHQPNYDDAFRPSGDRSSSRRTWATSATSPATVATSMTPAQLATQLPTQSAPNTVPTQQTQPVSTAQPVQQVTYVAPPTSGGVAGTNTDSRSIYAAERIAAERIAADRFAADRFAAGTNSASPQPAASAPTAWKPGTTSALPQMAAANNTTVTNRVAPPAALPNQQAAPLPPTVIESSATPPSTSSQTYVAPAGIQAATSAVASQIQTVDYQTPVSAPVAPPVTQDVTPSTMPAVAPPVATTPAVAIPTTGAAAKPTATGGYDRSSSFDMGSNSGPAILASGSIPPAATAGSGTRNTPFDAAIPEYAPTANSYASPPAAATPGAAAQPASAIQSFDTFPPSPAQSYVSQDRFSTKEIEQDIWGPSLRKQVPGEVLREQQAARAAQQANQAANARGPNGIAPEDRAQVPSMNESIGKLQPFQQQSQNGVAPIWGGNGMPEVDGAVGQVDQASRVMAVVGDQSILAGDLLWQINLMLAPHIGKAPEEELAKARVMGMRNLLPRMIENKLVYMDFLRSIPPDKFPELQEQIAEEFNKSKVPDLLKQEGVETPLELDQKLRKYGSSLIKQQQLFMEQVLGQQMVQQNVRSGKEITHAELLRYYYAHAKEYEYPARARWERLMVKWSSYPTKAAALQALRDMGTQVQKGAPFDEIARKGSDGPKKKNGGLYDWTTEGSLASDQINRVIFGIPLNAMSKILEHPDGASIIRVVQRESAGRKPFDEVQKKIKKTLTDEEFKKQLVAYLARLKTETQVWSAFDSPVNQAQPGSAPMMAQPQGDAPVRR